MNAAKDLLHLAEVVDVRVRTLATYEDVLTNVEDKDGKISARLIPEIRTMQNDIINLRQCLNTLTTLCDKLSHRITTVREKFDSDM